MFRVPVLPRVAGCLFYTGGLLEELPQPAHSGAGRIDLNKPRIRAALSAALALAPAPGGFTVAEHAAKVRQITGQDSYTARQAAYDLRKLRGKQLISKPGRTRRYHVPAGSARVIARCSPSATTSSRRSWPESAAPG